MGCGCKKRKKGKNNTGNCKGPNCDKNNNPLSPKLIEQRAKRAQILKDKLKALAKQKK
jgi:hypothetical protein